MLQEKVQDSTRFQRIPRPTWKHKKNWAL